MTVHITTYHNTIPVSRASGVVCARCGILPKPMGDSGVLRVEGWTAEMRGRKVLKRYCPDCSSIRMEGLNETEEDG